MSVLIKHFPQFSFATFLVVFLIWLIKHFDPHLIRAFDILESIRQTNRDVVEAINRAVDTLEIQQEWQEQLDAILTERHKRIMERFDTLDAAYVRVLYQMKACPQKENTDE